MLRPMRVAAALSFLLVAGVAQAHVTVRPKDARRGAEETYTMRVPTEMASPTRKVRLTIPAGVTVLKVDESTDGTFEVTKEGDRIVAITWTTDIEQGDFALFTFKARNPAEGDALTWVAQQTYGDGTVVDWVGPAGSKRPASVTALQP